ncbi:GNAT family N-acetyltransferase [Streptomyces sp. XY431]|uniref:GNAT family N-acetyltransferase n=1 Tax=Streptomyces sp. XY431 TaxID=1415562 RepID=UPI0006B02E55|nr:GNAT family N-acetyltransferase [Streptomyces sp. XY431]
MTGRPHPGPGRTDAELAAVQAEALYVMDDEGVLTAVNDVGRPAPARCFLSRTRASVRVWTSAELPAATATAIRAWAAAQPPVEDLTEVAEVPAEVARLVAGHRPVTDTFVGPAFAVLDPLASPELPGLRFEVCGPDRAEVFRADFPEVTATLAERQPTVAAFDGDRPVGVCCSARVGRWACEAGTETLPEYRGRGIASALVARWAEQVEATGRTALYSTEWDNHSSLAVARRLGLPLYAVNINLY